MTLKRATLGPLTSYEFGRKCEDIVFRLARIANGMIRAAAESGRYQITRKDAYDGTPKGDFKLDIDDNIQAEATALMRQLLPKGIGILGEEDELRQPSTLSGPAIVITIDPIDGTRVLELALSERRMPYPREVSVMLGVQVDGVAIAAFICDVATFEIHSRYPYATSITRALGSHGEAKDVGTLPRPNSLCEGTLLWHGNRPVLSSMTENLITAFGRDGQILRPQSSIGLCATQVLSSSAVTALIRSADGHTTPWDDTPIRAFGDADCPTGLVILKATEDAFFETEIPWDIKARHVDDLIYVRRDRLDDLRRLGPVRLLR